MSLLTRIAHIGDGTDDIAIHLFCAGLAEIHNNQITVQQFKNYWNMTTDEADDFDWLVTKYMAKVGDVARRNFIRDLKDILILTEGQVAWYTNETELRERINEI